MKHNKWKDELYELSGGSDDYGDCTVYVKEAIPFISSLLREQREEESIKVKVALETFCWERGLDKDPIVDVMKNRKKLNEYVLSILKGNKK